MRRNASSKSSESEEELTDSTPLAVSLYCESFMSLVASSSEDTFWMPPLLVTFRRGGDFDENGGIIVLKNSRSYSSQSNLETSQKTVADVHLIMSLSTISSVKDHFSQ